MKHIDGSQGEGGGQILRTALALSMITGEPFRIENIRAGRKKPGLMRQHLTCVQAAKSISSAEVRGDKIGSQELEFVPHTVRGGEYHFSVGTAGSTSLVFQAVLPALILASKPSTLTLEGGTHNPLAPPFSFIEKSFAPILQRMGPRLEMTIERFGFFPAGGGKVSIHIEPKKTLKPIDLLERGKLCLQLGESFLSHIDINIAERELNTIRKKMSFAASELKTRQVKNSPGPGNLVAITLEYEHVTEVFIGFGEKGVPAETVATRACQYAKEYLRSDAPVGPYLADQLLLPFALAGSGSFKTVKPNLHCTTNMDIIKMFLDVDLKITKEKDFLYRVDVV